jgi:hypothetical protein
VAIQFPKKVIASQVNQLPNVNESSTSVPPHTILANSDQKRGNHGARSTRGG